MLATAISYTPSFRFSSSLTPFNPYPLIKSQKPISFHQFPTSEPLSLGGFVSNTIVYEKNKIFGTKIMTELVRASASSSSDFKQEDEESIGFIQNETTLSSGTSRIEWTLNRLSKWLVATLFGIVVLWRHDAVTMWAALGAVINACLSVTLKRILNQKRPISTLRSGPGMPSSHAQSIFFAVSFAILSMVKSLGINEVTVTVGVLALGLSSYLSWLRVSQQLHTISQVVVGAILGSICSIFWFQAWHLFVLKAFISFLWVRIVIVLGAATFCVCFFLYVIRHWVMDVAN